MRSKKFLSVLILACLLGQVALAETENESTSSLDHALKSDAKSFEIGPTLNLISAPYLASVGIEAKFNRQFGVGLDWGFIPELSIPSRSSRASDMSLLISGPSLNVSAYPWKESFFIGLGTSLVLAKASQVSRGNMINVEAGLLFLTPQLGWRFVSNSGFFFATKFGLMVCLSSFVTASSSDPETDDLLKTQVMGQELARTGKTQAGLVVPYLTLAQFGWFF
jgi:hypothetical protein